MIMTCAALHVDRYTYLSGSYSCSSCETPQRHAYVQLQDSPGCAGDNKGGKSASYMVEGFSKTVSLDRNSRPWLVGMEDSINEPKVPALHARQGCQRWQPTG
jgi:hypothetical protein